MGTEKVKKEEVVQRSQLDNKSPYKPRWRDLYRAHRSEEKHIARVATHPLERAVYVSRNRDRLGDKMLWGGSEGTYPSLH